MVRGYPKDCHSRVIVRLQGGLGNQLFQYAAAQRLAVKNGVPLKLDATSGFQRDYYQRSYSLRHFFIKEDFAGTRDCLLGRLGRIRYRIYCRLNRPWPSEGSSYVPELSKRADPSVLDLRVNRAVYLDGFWQSEAYFRDIEDRLREELRFRGPHSQENVDMARSIQESPSVCVHIRQLHGIPRTAKPVPLDPQDPRSNFVDTDYYDKAVQVLLRTVNDPHFFVFSDCPEWTRKNVRFDHPTTFVDHNDSERDYEDMWLMSGCKHFIIGNSTFSWWGAWLGSFKDKIVIAPSKGFSNTTDMMPRRWIVI